MTTSLAAMRSELNAVMSSSAPGLPSADALCDTCVGLFDVDGAAVSMVYDGMSWGTFGSSSPASRRLDEYQFTFGEGPCLDAVASGAAVLVPDLDSPLDQRWPAFREAVLGDGFHGVFALPIMITSVCVGALDLFRGRPGPLEGDALAGAMLAAELASAPLLDLIAEAAVANGRADESLADGAESAERLFMDGLDRVEVYQATGMLISALDVDAAEALVRLRAHAIATGRTASEVARDIIERRLIVERDDWHGPNDTGGGDAAGGDVRSPR